MSHLGASRVRHDPPMVNSILPVADRSYDSFDRFFRPFAMSFGGVDGFSESFERISSERERVSGRFEPIFAVTGHSEIVAIGSPEVPPRSALVAIGASLVSIGSSLVRIPS